MRIRLFYFFCFNSAALDRGAVLRAALPLSAACAWCAILKTNRMNCASCAPRVARFVLAALAALACCVPRVQFHVLAALATRALDSVPVAYAASVRARARALRPCWAPSLRCVAGPRQL